MLEHWRRAPLVIVIQSPRREHPGVKASSADAVEIRGGNHPSGGSIRLRLRPIPALQDNYIWMLDQGSDAIIVDPGAAKPALDTLTRDQLNLSAILLTHHHADHVGGVAAILREYPSARVFAPHDARIRDPAERVGEGDRIRIDDLRVEFDVLEIPGHTTSHIAFAGAGLLFCGDTLFSLGCGRMFEGTPAQFQHSLSRLAALPGDTRVCCGHEYTVANARFARSLDADNGALTERERQADELRAAGLPTVPSTLEAERATNPFLRLSNAAVLSALQRRHGVLPLDATEAFMWLRAWKDAFRATDP